jgi:hypothetical protein
VDRFRGKRSLERLTMDELDREKIKLDLQERKQIQQTQTLERQKEKFFAQGLRESSDQMKLYYARKVKELDADVRLNDRVMRALSHKVRIYNGIVSVKRWMQILSEDKKSLLNKLSLAELSQWIEQNTVNGELRETQLNRLLDEVERGTGVVADVDANEEADVQQIYGLMKNAPIDVKPPEEIARDSMAEVNTILREREA